MSDSPSIVRQETQHSVSVTEGSLVATSRPSDPAGPVVRQNLAGQEQTDAPEQEANADLPPPITAEAEPEAVIYQRRQDGSPEEVVQAPDPQAPLPEPQALAAEPQVAEPESAAPVFERSLQDHSVAVPLPAALDAAQQDGQSAVDRFLREKRLAEQAQSNPPAESETGPVLERSMQDRFVALPPDSAGSASSDGPVLQRAMADRFVAVTPLPAAGTPEQAIVQAPREGSSRPAAVAAPALEPVPLAQAQQIIADTAQEVQARVEEAVGAADGQWAEMDFPARVVKLRIENDKVRVKLDELEQMADEQAQQTADQRAR